MPKVWIDEEKHKYYCGKKEYTSVGKVFKETVDSDPFDPDKMSLICALKQEDLDWYEKTKSSVGGYDKDRIINRLLSENKVIPGNILAAASSFINTWEEKARLGTLFHKKMELQDIARGFCINTFNNKSYETVINKTEKDNESYFLDMKDTKDGYYPEYIVFNHVGKIAGTIDKLFVETINGKKYADIDDWKTDDEIQVIPSYWKTPKLNFPFDHIYNTNFGKYSVKLGMYAWLLEQSGIIPRDIRFTSVSIDKESLDILDQKIYNVSYRKKELEILMKKFGI